jgi:hypothetical protein
MLLFSRQTLTGTGFGTAGCSRLSTGSGYRILQNSILIYALSSAYRKRKTKKKGKKRKEK